MPQVIIHHRLAGGNFNDASPSNPKHPAAHRHVVLVASSIAPPDDADNQGGEKVRMPRLDAEGAAPIFRSDMEY